MVTTVSFSGSNKAYQVEKEVWQQYVLRMQRLIQGDKAPNNSGDDTNNNAKPNNPLPQSLPFITSGIAFCLSFFRNTYSVLANLYHSFRSKKFNYGIHIRRRISGVKDFGSNMVSVFKKTKDTIAFKIMKMRSTVQNPIPKKTHKQ